MLNKIDKLLQRGFYCADLARENPPIVNTPLSKSYLVVRYDALQKRKTKIVLKQLLTNHNLVNITSNGWWVWFWFEYKENYE